MLPHTPVLHAFRAQKASKAVRQQRPSRRRSAIRGPTFDAYAGETIKVLAVYDKTSGERELVESRKADEFPDA